VTHELKLERLVDAPPDVVFDAYVDPDAQHDLYADAPEWLVESQCDLRVGGRWSITFGPPGSAPARETNVFEQIERPRLLVYASTMMMPDGSSFDTRVHVTLEEANGKTRMTLVQSGFATAELRDEISGGWASILEGFERVARARAAGRERDA
jgi:uncharacterized protein YndB with AHSA1/START domain